MATMLRMFSVAVPLAFVLLAAPASAADFSDVGPLPAVGDTDGDGYPEASDEFSTPQCGCACPVVGAGFEAQAAGQELFVVAATSGCQTAYAYDADPGDADPDGDIAVEPFTICWPAGALPCGSIAA